MTNLILILAILMIYLKVSSSLSFSSQNHVFSPISRSIHRVNHKSMSLHSISRKGYVYSPIEVVWNGLKTPADDVIDAIDSYRVEKNQNHENTSKLVINRINSSINSKYKRLTVSDVSSLTGRDLQSSKENLILLAKLVQANLQVTNDGDIVYLFSKDQSLRNTLRVKSLSLKIKEVINSLAIKLYYAYRVSFGLILLASITVVFVSLIVILSSSGDSNNDSSSSSSSSSSRSRSNSRSSSSYSGISFGNFGGIFQVNPLEIIFRPTYDYTNQNVREQEVKMTEYDADEIITPYTESFGRKVFHSVPIFEAFYSYLFGDNNPNEDFERAQIIAVSRRIRELRGVVAAEDLAPYLNPPPFQVDSNPLAIVNENWMLDAVTSLGGSPVVTENGNIAYVFEDVVVSAIKDGTYDQDARRKNLYCPLCLQEKRIPFSLASKTSLFIAGGLGILNLIGVILLGINMATPANFVNSPQLFVTLSKIFPALCIFAILYNVIPSIRYVMNIYRNKNIQKRNTIRREWAEALNVRVNERNPLTDKIQDVRDYAKKLGLKLRRASEENIALDTSDMGVEQNLKKEFEKFDKKLGSV